MHRSSACWVVGQSEFPQRVGAGMVGEALPQVIFGAGLASAGGPLTRLLRALAGLRCPELPLVHAPPR
jgi:hypothetical protein